MPTFLTTRVLSIATVVSLAAAVCWTAVPAVALAEAGQDPALVAKGLEVYNAQKCSACHMVAGKGSKVSPLDGVGAKLTADQIREWITNPTEMSAKMKSTKKPPMPNRYSKLPKADLDALVAYLQTLK